MKVSNFVIAVACLVLLVLLGGSAGTAVYAQQSTPVLRMGRYNKASEVVVSGTVQSIQTQQSGTNLPRGTYLILQSTPLTLNVHMGLFSPASIPFKIGDTISVTGSLTTINGTQILLARQVQSSSQHLMVRSSNGFVVRPRPTGQTSGALQ